MARMGWRAGMSVFLKGMAMGAADIVPGVSGGTIALITGIYERLIQALNAIDHRLWRTIKQNGLPALWHKIDGNFLTLLLMGIMGSVLSLANLLHLLLADHPILVWSFFFGLIAASAYFVGKRAKRLQFGTVLSFLLGTGIAFSITLFPPMAAPESSYLFFFAGMLAISAMILPGISGSFILVLLGAYKVVLGAIKDLDLAILGFMAGGCAVGLLTFSKILNWMFRRYHDLTIAMMSGFLLGSLNKVWPWKGNGSAVHGKELPGSNLLPGTFESLSDQDPQLIYAIILAILGAASIAVVEKNSQEEAQA